MGENGLAELARKYKKEFKIPENINYYSKKDYNSAKRKYVLYKLGRLENGNEEK